MDDGRQSAGRRQRAAPPLAVVGPYGPAILRCGYLHAAEAEEILLSRPNSYRMIGVKDGTVVLVRNGGAGESCGPAGVMLLQPGDEYALRLSPGTHLISLIFDVVHQPRQGHPGDLRHVPPASRQPPPMAVWGVDLPARVPAKLAAQCMLTLELIRNEHWQRPAVYARACGRLGLLLGDLAAEASAPAEGAPHGGYWSDRLERLLRDRPSMLPTATQAAAAMAISREHLSRCYHQETGVTLSHRLAEERWRRACDMLANTEAAIAAVARRVGYRRAGSFAKAFRSARGMTPTDFRRLARQGLPPG